MLQLGAAKFLLGVGAGIVQPSPPGTTVNVGVGVAIASEKAGFVIDLTERDPINVQVETSVPELHVREPSG
jgi:hypothetical protein